MMAQMAFRELPLVYLQELRSVEVGGLQELNYFEVDHLRLAELHARR